MVFQNLVEPHPLEWLMGIATPPNEITSRLECLFSRGIYMSKKRKLPVRVIGRSYITTTGLVTSTKDGVARDFEGSLESDFSMLMDFDWKVDSYLPQPFVVDYADPSGRPRTYTPDYFMRFKVRGMKPLLVEVKSTQSIEKEGDLHHWQTEAGERFARQHGWRFKVYTEDEIRTPYLRNAKFLRRFRTYSPQQKDINAVRDILAAKGEIAVEALVEHAVTVLNHSITAPHDLHEVRLRLLSVVWWHIAEGFLYVDLEQLVTNQSPIRPRGDGELVYSPFK
jgi:hypothetical protein